MNKRIKISFKTVNAGRVTEVDSNDLVESNQRIKTAMKKVVRQYKRNETLSKRDAGTLVLNA